MECSSVHSSASGGDKAAQVHNFQARLGRCRWERLPVLCSRLSVDRTDKLTTGRDRLAAPANEPRPRIRLAKVQPGSCPDQVLAKRDAANDTLHCAPRSTTKVMPRSVYPAVILGNCLFRLKTCGPPVPLSILICEKKGSSFVYHYAANPIFSLTPAQLAANYSLVLRHHSINSCHAYHFPSPSTTSRQNGSRRHNIAEGGGGHDCRGTRNRHFRRYGPEARQLAATSSWRAARHIAHGGKGRNRRN